MDRAIRLCAWRRTALPRATTTTPTMPFGASLLRPPMSRTSASTSTPPPPAPAPTPNAPPVVATAQPTTTTTPHQEEENGLRYRPVPKLDLRGTLNVYNELSKSRLAMLVTLTTMAGYAFAPTATALTTLVAATVGTHLTIASANTFNQLAEIPYDAQMARTRTRPLVRGAISPPHALGFAVATGLAGIGTLYTLVNPLTAGLGAANLVLYSFIYTPLKRVHAVNTWVGAVVGAIPPMMGWTACTNSLLNFPTDGGAWLLGFLLYAWQFPHFNALAHNLRADYAKAGYRMIASTDPPMNARVALRYALAMLPVPFLAAHWGLTTWAFVGTASVVNGAMAVCAVRFWRQRSDKHARELFFSSLVHLPVMLAAMLIHRRPREDEEQVGLVDRVAYAFGYLVGRHEHQILKVPAPIVSSTADKDKPQSAA